MQVEDLNNECFAEELDPSIKKKNWLKQQAAEEAARAGQDRTQPIPVSLDWYEIQEYERAFKVSHIQEYERAFKVSHIQEYERAFKVSHVYAITYKSLNGPSRCVAYKSTNKPSR